MRPPDEIRELLAAMQRADDRLVAADEAIVDLKARLQTAQVEQGSAREGWRRATLAMAEALGAIPPVPLEQKQAELVAVVVPRVPRLPEPSQSRAVEIRTKVLRVLTERNRPVALAELCQAVNATPNETSRQLWELTSRQKLAQQISRGFYAIASWRKGAE